MESGNGGASSKGVLVPVSETSVVFQNNILAPLKSAYLYEESKQSFRYKSAVLVKNSALEEKYYAFRENRREAGYSEEDLKESYGFLLFDDVNKANALGETGVLTGNSTCTTLGDPSNGVYISMYSDCLDQNRWYHGKSGYIAIIRLTKGRVKKVVENYTQNFTVPTVGFDCHVSEQLPSVSANTSSFLAFERTQYYMYERLDNESKATTQSPSAACPFAIVSFSYTDTKATFAAPQEKSEKKKLVLHYFPWKGQLQIGTQFYDVGLRSTAGALIPAELPPVVKIDRAISMVDLRKLLPRAVFETCYSGEVFLDGLYCTLCELVSFEAEETKSLSLLLREIKEKDLALTIQLNDGGFLILLHSSHFLTYDDTGSSTDVLQGMFVFPVSQVIQRGTKSEQKRPAMSSEILRILPVLSYAEGEVEKNPIYPDEELCEVLAQHMQSYAALINPGLASPSREISIFPDQYDVLDAHKHLYSSPEWTNRAWQSFRSYLSKPVSFQLPVSKASEILAAGQEERMEDLDDDVYICLSSPEEAPANPVSMELEDKLTGQRSPVNIETSVDSGITSAEAQEDITPVPKNVIPDDLQDGTISVDNGITSAEAQVDVTPLPQNVIPDDLQDGTTSVDRDITSAEAQKDLIPAPQNVVPDDLQAGDVTKDTGKSDLTVLITTDKGARNLLTPPTSDDLPAELIVSITSAERTVTDESISMISTVSATKHNDFQLSGFPAAKLQTAEVNSLNDDTVTTKKVLDCPEVTNLTKTKRRKLRRGYYRGRKKVSKVCLETPSLKKFKTPVEYDNLNSQLEGQAKESSAQQELSNPSDIGRRKIQRGRRIFGKSLSKNVGLAVQEEKKSDAGKQTLENTILMELAACPLRKKTERWDLKPIISECGRILVPHGSADIADQIKSLKDKLQPKKDEECQSKMSISASENAHCAVEMEYKSSTAPETAVDETEATTSKDRGNRLQNVSDVNSEHSIVRPSDDDNGSLTLNQESSVHSSKTDGTSTPSSEAVQEKRTDTLSPAKCATKGEFLLSKLKSVLLRGKRKTDNLASEERPADTAKDTEPCLKKGKIDSDTGMLKTNYAITSVQDTNVYVKEVSKMLSVDPLFAYALGLTPKATPDRIQKTEGQDTQQRKDSSDTQEQTILDKQPQIIQRPPSIFPRRGRIKMLKKHQGISTEYVRKKWWLHFQTPACFASEKLKYKECTRDNSISKTDKEKMNSACSSTDALNLLADLALSASNDQVPPQPDPALERKPETSLKKSDLTNDVTSAEQESVLHALLRQPAARPMQPLESPSPSHLMGGSELVGLISKEHAYSLPPSSSLLLGLPGTPFQVSPLSGSTRLLHHHQTMYGDGINTLHPSISQDDRSEQNHRTPEYLKRYMGHRRKFRQSRTFVSKDGSIQVTKQWKENYDFNLDSKFTSDSKDKTIVRALHGPWDFSMQDTSEEVRLIVHMWIGLFYSRSTARLFHVDSNSCSEERDSLELSSGMVPAPSPELKASSFAPFPSVTDTSDPSFSKALDLSKKDDSVLDQGPLILDLSMKNSKAEIVTSDPQVNRKDTSVSGDGKEASETLNTPKSSVGLEEASTMQCYKKMVHSTEIQISEGNDVRSTFEDKRTCTPSQKAGSLDNTDVPSCKGTFILEQEEIKSASSQQENNQTGPGSGHMSCECNDEPVGIENSEHTAKSIVQKQERNSSKSVTDEEVDSKKEADDVVHAVEHDKIDSKEGENLEVKEKPWQEDNVESSPTVVDTGDDSTNTESGVLCNGPLENEKQLSQEKPTAVSPGKVENVNEDEDCSEVNTGNVMEDEDHLGKEDRLDEKDRCDSPVKADSDLSDQPVPMMCDGPDSVKDGIIECYHKPPLDEEPPQVNSEEDACHDLQLRQLCATSSVMTDEQAISEKSPEESLKMEPIAKETAVEEHLEKDVCLADKTLQTAALAMSDENNCSLDDSNSAGLIPQTNDSVETGSQIKVMENFSLSCDDHEDGDTQSFEGEQKVDNVTEKELFHHQSHSLYSEAKVTLFQETDLKQIDKINDGLEKINGRVVIPFIGIDTSEDNTVQPHGSPSPGKVEEVVQGQEEIPFISGTNYPETVLPTEVCSTSQMYSKKAELPAGRISLSLLHVSENNQLVVSENEYDGRCSTPTMDEKPYEYLPCSGPSASASDFSGGETTGNKAHKCLDVGLISQKDEMLLENKLCHKSTVNSDAMPHRDLHPDLELRTLRVLQSIDKYLPKSSHTDKTSQIETADMKHSIDQTPNPTSKCMPPCLALRHTSADVINQKISNTKSAMGAAPTSQELQTESTGHFLISPFKRNLEEVLGVKLQFKKTDSSVPQHYFERTDKLQEASVGQDYCHPYRSVPSTESLQAIKPNIIDQDKHKTTSQTNISHEPHSYSQRPVMAVKPSKSDESQADSISIDRLIEKAAMSHFSRNKQTKTPVVTHTTPTTMLLEKKTEKHKRNSERLNDDKQETSEHSSISSWLSNVTDSKSYSDKAQSVCLDPFYQHQGRGTSKFNKMLSSSLPVQSFESAGSSSKHVDGNQGFMTYSLVEKFGQTTKEGIAMDQTGCSDTSTSRADYKDGGMIDDSLLLDPQSSLICTVYNTTRKRPYSFLEQVSRRCLQDDITEASMEQECLIFSEQMRQLLKRSKKGPTMDTHDKLHLSCASPVTVQFSSLEEQEDAVEHLNAHLDPLSVVGQKIKVDMSDRKDLADTTEEEKTFHSQKTSQGTGNPMEHPGISCLTSECARLYEAKMNDVCAVRKVPSTPKHFKMDRGYLKTESSNHFDFCDQMKREMDESFRSKLNSVVKKSCKTKYRFYILVTSDDPFFEETKAQLEAEGHTAVQPSEFFLSEDSASSLLIILRNEDIAEHICEVPRLLELKNTPGVQFAGIDEPDDVVNLTHQELFTRGGFIMFDRAALEPLSLCNIQKMAEILKELSRTGKWKWMLHYRDSRRLKENARLSAEAKEKKQFLNWCQEAGIMEVMPYHECDLMSRDRPDYLTCLVRLQVQNISARYPVFITDSTTDSTFGRNGILTMTFSSFLTCSPSETFTA
ncbi:protein TASOR 2 isoform X1 [Epinephelus moara]|uniref:protein TASOR 2 isoform X1 n=1 Tax=Epinephelus moara TaxID=300413 RepID=UPI00214E6B75|nr:protein TASOR 2 isoform X1 [Epinephelus moara]